MKNFKTEVIFLRFVPVFFFPQQSLFVLYDKIWEILEFFSS
jgi:hypothetical protein